MSMEPETTSTTKRKERMISKRIDRMISKRDEELRLRKKRLADMKANPCSTKFEHFEIQVKPQCQMHAINNALQRAVLRPGDIEARRKILLDKLKNRNHLHKPPIGGPSGFWEKEAVFEAFIAKGGKVTRAKLAVDGSQTDAFVDKMLAKESDQAFIMYVEYINKTVVRKKATLNEVKHCVAYRNGCVLDSALKAPIELHRYPYLTGIKAVYEVCIPPTVKPRKLKK